MPDKILPVEELLTLLSAAPARIAETTDRLSAVQLRTSPAPDAWSLVEVLAHLRSCSDMWGDAIYTILTQEKPTFKAVNPTTWIEQTNYRELEFRPSFEAFAQQRTELLAILKSLLLEAWSRSATVLIAGHPRERTVHFYAQWLATHERTHVRQIAREAKTFHS